VVTCWLASGIMFARPGGGLRPCTFRKFRDNKIAVAGGAARVGPGCPARKPGHRARHGSYSNTEVSRVV
jgi:hypothetical protein